MLRGPLRVMHIGIPMLVILAASTFVVTAVLIPLLARIAPRLHLLDQPGGRKLHERAVPLVGGVVIAVASLLMLAIVSVWLPRATAPTWWFYLSILLMLVVGILDDVFELSHLSKAALQLLAVLPVVIWGGLKITNLGALFGGGDMLLGAFAIPFILLCLIGYINATNMIDGLDGLAGGITFISLILLTVCAGLWGLSGIFLIGLAFAASALAFLVYNLRTPWRRKATVFLGDAGSMVLGLTVAWCAIQLVGKHQHAGISAMSIAWVLALPVMDTLVVMARRILLRRNPFTPDRLHLHHVLVDIGLSQGQATAVLLLLSFFYGAFGLASFFAGVPDWVLFVSFICVLMLHGAFVSLCYRHVHSASMRLARQDSTT